MYGNFRIKYQDELEKLPYFNKGTSAILLGKTGTNLDRKIERLTKSGYLLRLKNGLYTTKIYSLTVTDKEDHAKKIAAALCFPSYLSLEYILTRTGIIPELVNTYTSITTKTTRDFSNFWGRFSYQNIREKLFTGFKGGEATKAKALFDFLYLKSNLNRNFFIEISQSLRINWDRLERADLEEFEKYMELSGSLKMSKLYIALRKLIK